MIRFLVVLIVSLVVFVGLVLAFTEDPGYFLVRWDKHVFEGPVAGLLTVLFVLLLLGNMVLWLLRKRKTIVPAIRNSREARRVKGARESLTRGLIEMNEGRWADAEKSLTSHATNSDIPLLHYLGAARAAQLQGQTEKRDKYLRRAHESSPQAKIAVSLTQAELQMSHNQLDQALATLNHLQEEHANHPYVLKLLVRVYEELQDWDGLYSILPMVERKKLTDAEEFERLSCKTHLGRLQQLSTSEKITDWWNSLNRKLRDDLVLQAAYAKHLHQAGDTGQVAGFIRQTLKKRWNEALVLQFGELELSDAEKQLGDVESWFKPHGQQAALQLVAGRLAARAEFWGKARKYLEDSLAQAPRPTTWKAYAGLLEHVGEPDEAMKAYKSALAAQAA